MVAMFQTEMVKHEQRLTHSRGEQTRKTIDTMHQIIKHCLAQTESSTMILEGPKLPYQAQRAESWIILSLRIFKWLSASMQQSNPNTG